MTARDLTWKQDGACRDLPFGAMFPEHNEQSASGKRAWARAARVCDGCPVRDECLAYALAGPEDYGVWGGTTPMQRLEIRKPDVAAARRARATKAKRRQRAGQQELAL